MYTYLVQYLEAMRISFPYTTYLCALPCVAYQLQFQFQVTSVLLM